MLVIFQYKLIGIRVIKSNVEWRGFAGFSDY